MFQNNPLLAQLKKNLHAKTPRVEGIVKSTERGFGFLEVDAQKSYFIPPKNMKNVMHGDKISAVLKIEKDREIAEPEKLIEPFLNRFVGKIEKKDNKLFIFPDYPFLKDFIACRPKKSCVHVFQTGDWAVAKLIQHKLNGNHIFYAELIEEIVKANNPLIPWWVTLSRHNLERKEPKIEKDDLILKNNSHREDLTHLNFITIDNFNTKDIDDALFIEEIHNGNLRLIVAIADPTSYIKSGSKLDITAAKRGFTNYLPGFNVPMLPRSLSEDICSLNPHERRPVLACCITILKDGNICSKINFFLAWIKSKSKLSYDNVSDWIEKKSSWKPETKSIENQILLLHRLCLLRIKWRTSNAVLFQDSLEYRFQFSETGIVEDVVIEKRRIAHKIIEESMIIANISAANFLSKNLGFGIYNTHAGFDPINAENVVSFLNNYNLKFTVKEITTLKGFCNLRRVLNILSDNYINSRIRRYQSFGDFSITPSPHFALGLVEYATWTSPIRKYSDMINHRLLKSIINQDTNITKPSEDIKLKISEQKRRNRIAERDISDWLYTLLLQKKEFKNKKFNAEIIDVSRSGIRAKLLENGANVFIPALFLHPIREELVFNQETGKVFIKGVLYYKISDLITVVLSEIRLQTRSIIARIDH
ncbi:exoribonuclease II [Buchnera aphidicola]|uniref:Exoribonuclease 2 n=1 Tax=Buchnera aphidicola subsp. Schizaphis graminum (strain Sg) TaxID=198804 RepID=RNB_BUCAP|nr:exoribonuclease II [Buchnera aphidicola]Q8K9Q5.1 RecName: Full=Exoribonuclease 2; AltName: Full=Exoribonuclease II; Short=RNase II; Short=Ribonuclease II [Buchnera aphidicola str. Sg (Schizaphis graminum)]AAM67814.1 exoribonuclease II [Buchnera aphidicola str. Sg (Schizaphis graminum)]AWI49688.1 exoribonuclease II [Buchnera aphidicola (Schizaphis graminum)]